MAVNDLLTLLFESSLLVGQRGSRISKISLMHHLNPTVHVEHRTARGLAKLEGDRAILLIAFSSGYCRV